jgi:Membrane bound O-acyl transferase family
MTNFFIAVVGGIYFLKMLALWRRRGTMAWSGIIAFLFAWPGVVPTAFAERGASRKVDAGQFLAAWTRMMLGASAIVLLAVYAPQIPEPVLGLAGIEAILLAIHLGFGDLLPWLLRWAGFGVPMLFDRPWAAQSLDDFWSRRWNLVFVEMNRRLFLRPLCSWLGKRKARFAVFVISGLFHELGISFPAGGGWGFPLSYFLLQGALVAVEERFQIRNRAWTWFWLLAPAPWLFHTTFRHTLVVPLFLWLHGLIAQHPAEWYLSLAIYLAALGHLLVLLVSVQAPVRLGWKEDIPKLTRFNQKVFWVYGSYILLCIVSFALLTLWLHDDLLAGVKAARALALFIATFWTIRVAVDFVWYDYRDWPPGNALVMGHALATSLFSGLALIYWAVVAGVAR